METNEPKVLCSYCLSPIPPAAKKCSACLEFTAGNQSAAKPSQKAEIVKAILDCVGKLGIPVAVIVFLLLFRHDMSELFARAHSAKFGENTITFDLPRISKGTIDLHPVALYWLMQAAKRPNTEYRHDFLTPEDFNALDELTNKGLATYVVTERKPTSDADAKFFGTKSIHITATSKGLEFLQAIGLELPAVSRDPLAPPPGDRLPPQEHKP